jgi:hypothetical protein
MRGGSGVYGEREKWLNQNNKRENNRKVYLGGRDDDDDNENEGKTDIDRLWSGGETWPSFL